MSAPLVNVTVDDKPLQVPAGTNLVEVAKLAGVEIPHYCYHRKLSIAGNCRMCLVEVGLPKLGADKQPERGADGKPVINWMPKLQIGCNTTASEGMVCRTRSAKVEQARRGVMEFLLINHPLDCPICDKAGECRLQEFAVDYGQGGSRFTELKVRKPKRVPLGPKIVLDMERCIMCSRCERFMREVAGQDCLGFTQRGSHVELTCYPGEWPNTNYDLNITDICPVGALTAVDFRFRMRPWFLKETRSVCANCARGCNTSVWSRDDVIYRQTPRDNEAVNGSWMCDYGRLTYRYVNAPERLQAPVVQGAATGWPEALAAAGRLLAPLARTGALAVIGSARATTEEQFLLARLRREAGATLCDCVPRSGDADGKLLLADRNPNTAGARLMGLASATLGEALPRIAAGIRSGAIRGLLVHGENIAAHGIPADLLQRLECLVVIDILPNETTRCAQVVLPGASFAEKPGTFINADGRLQRIGMAFRAPGQARPDWSILAALLGALGAGDVPASFDETFRAMTAPEGLLNDVKWEQIGEGGLALWEAGAASEAVGQTGGGCT